jgi:hypothetical protein
VKPNADPTRRAVLELLRKGSQPRRANCQRFSGVASGHFQTSSAFAPGHLVNERREGRNRVYQLNLEPLNAVDSWLEQYRAFSQANLSSLNTFVEAEYAKGTGQHHAVKKITNTGQEERK